MLCAIGRKSDANAKRKECTLKSIIKFASEAAEIVMHIANIIMMHYNLLLQIF